MKNIRTFLLRYKGGIKVPQEHVAELATKMIHIRDTNGVDQFYAFYIHARFFDPYKGIGGIIAIGTFILYGNRRFEDRGNLRLYHEKLCEANIAY